MQVREDGVEIDQIVISPTTYANNAPGPVSNDNTIVPKPNSQPPATPGSPNPANGATGVDTAPTLTWSAAGATTYDVRFGTTNPPEEVSPGQTSASYNPGALSNGTQYFWQIVANNAAGSTSGPIWSFTTSATPPPPPSTPASPGPANGATGIGTTPTLTWTSAGATTYDVLFGTTNPPSQVSTGQASASFTPSAPLANNTQYFWQIVSRNASGTTTGPVWSFTTLAAPVNTEIVIYASDIPSANLHGSWSVVSDPASPDGMKLTTPDNGFATTNNPLAAPTHFVDVTFNANANTRTRSGCGSRR